MRKFIAIVLCFAFICSSAYAQKGGRSFSGGSSPSSSRSYSSPRISPRSPGSSLAKARASQQSSVAKSNFLSKSSPVQSSNRANFNTSTPSKVSVAPTNNYSNRNVRITNVYKSYPSNYNNHHYNDSFHPFLTGMLIGRLMDNNHHTETVRYIHSHWDEFDEARKQQLLRENASLKDELAKLNGTPRDTSAGLTGVDRDVMYNDHIVTMNTNAGFSLFKVFMWLVLISLFVAIIYCIFCMRFDI